MLVFGEAGPAGESAFRLSFEYRRQRSGYKVLCDKRKQTYNTPGKRQHGSIPADCHAVENTLLSLFSGVCPPYLSKTFFRSSSAMTE
jgi:hypothetical protein